MLFVTAHAVISTLYITSYQHVYSQSQTPALILGQTSSSLEDDLEDLDYLVTTGLAVPPGLGEFDIVILEGSVDLSGSLEIIEEYVENGGGLVYLGGAAESLQLSANYDWLGAQTVGSSGFGENATVTIDNPLDSSLAVGDILRLQSGEQLGAILVDDLESDAAILASYTNGGVFAYNYTSGGKVYFQAYADAGIGDVIAQANVEELLISGILWATAQPDPVTNLLPLGTGITTDNNKPTGSSVVIFSEAVARSLEVSVPEDPAMSIFVTADSGLTNPILYFTVDGQEYRYNVQIDKGTLLTFPSALNVTSARFAVDNWVSGVGVVGYVTLRSPPLCNLPTGVELTPTSSIPPDAVSLGSPDPTGFVKINNPPIPITSLLVGFEHEVNGYLLEFDSASAHFQCPIPELIEIAFDNPTVVSNGLVKNDGPWGEVGYEEILSNATAFAKFTIPKGTVLPIGFTIERSSEAPSHIQSATFSQDALDVRNVAAPDKKVSAIWVSADDGLVDPYLYLKAGDEWYSIEIDQVNGALIDFTPSMQFEEIYASADGGQAGPVSVGYVYPIQVNARAGSDQSVLEEQLVYLDARASSGPLGQMSFKWTQVGGPTVSLRDANTDRAHFSTPEVSELGERISFRLVVTDSDGVQSSDIVVINVKDVKIPNNLPPSIGSVAGATVDEGAQVVLAASAFDSDGDTLKYSWTQKDGPPARLSGANTPTLSIIAPVVTVDSILTFEIRVADGRGHAVTKDVVVTVLNVRDEIVPVDASISAGKDQFVLEGSVVQLVGEYQSGASSDQEFRWEQTAGTPVTLNVQSALNASFVAPQTDGSTLLTFRLGISDSQGTITRWDDVSVMVNTAQVPVVDNSVEIEEEGAQTPSSFEIEPTFSAVRRVDAEPPTEIHRLSILGADGASSPTPTAQVVGIWLDSDSDMSGLELHFSASGRKYSINAMADQATAYVFDRQVDVLDVRLTSSSDVQSIGIGYYYDQVPLASVSPSTTQALPQEEPGAIQAMPPQEGAIIKFARENQIAAGLMAIAVPVGIGVGLKMATTHRRKKLANPARKLFPKNDPVAGDAAKVRPVIEELEKMLGRDLDTAVSASELLDKFGSGRGEASQR